MLQTLFRTAAAVTCAAVLLAASPARAANRTVVIRLYDTATFDAAGREAAMRTASDAIASAGMKVEWRDCSRGGAAHPCRTVRDAGELVVRILPARSSATRPSFAATVSSGDGEVQLGFAPIDPSGRGTVIATVYYDVVLQVAQRTGLPASDLMGRAIAHEVGHLLLRAPGHPESGLMRGLWTDAELIENRPSDWTFSAAERHQLQTTTRAPEPPVSAPPADDGEFEQLGR